MEDNTLLVKQKGMNFTLWVVTPSLVTYFDYFMNAKFIPPNFKTGVLRRTDILDLNNLEWRRGPDLPIAIRHGMSEIIQGSLYLIGGMSGGT